MPIQFTETIQPAPRQELRRLAVLFQGTVAGPGERWATPADVVAAIVADLDVEAAVRAAGYVKAESSLATLERENERLKERNESQFRDAAARIAHLEEQLNASEEELAAVKADLSTALRAREEALDTIRGMEHDHGEDLKLIAKMRPVVDAAILWEACQDGELQRAELCMALDALRSPPAITGPSATEFAAVGVGSVRVAPPAEGEPRRCVCAVCGKSPGEDPTSVCSCACHAPSAKPSADGNGEGGAVPPLSVIADWLECEPTVESVIAAARTLRQSRDRLARERSAETRRTLAEMHAAETALGRPLAEGESLAEAVRGIVERLSAARAAATERGYEPNIALAAVIHAAHNHEEMRKRDLAAMTADRDHKLDELLRARDQNRKLVANRDHWKARACELEECVRGAEINTHEARADRDRLAASLAATEADRVELGARRWLEQMERDGLGRVDFWRERAGWVQHLPRAPRAPKSAEAPDVVSLARALGWEGK